MTFEKSDFRKNGTLTIEGELKEHDSTEIVCELPEITKLIVDWTRSGGWQFETFVEFLHIIGLNEPFILSDYNRWNRTFKCKTSDNIEAEIDLTVGDCDDIDSIISVTIGNEKRIYSILNINMKPGESIPILYFDGRIICDKNRRLVSRYYGYSCYWELQMENYRLQIKILEPDDSEERIVTQKSAEIERYLMSISIIENVNINILYNNITSIIGFSKEQIAKSSNIIIGHYTQNNIGTLTTLNKISIVYGDVEEITISFEDETYTVDNNGSWAYSLNQDARFWVKYDSTTGQYELKSVGNEEEVFLLTDIGTLISIKEEVKRLRKKYFSNFCTGKALDS